MWVIVSRRGTCFWDGRFHVQRNVKTVRRQSVRITLKEFENVNAFSNRTEREDTVVSQDNHVLYLLRLALLLSLVATHCSRSGLHGVEAAFTLCLLLRFRARLLTARLHDTTALLFCKKKNKNVDLKPIFKVPTITMGAPPS